VETRDARRRERGRCVEGGRAYHIITFGIPTTAREGWESSRGESNKSSRV